MIIYPETWIAGNFSIQSVNLHEQLGNSLNKRSRGSGRCGII